MRYSRGVTLLELMIVVTIVALTTAFALPAYQSYLQRADRSAVQADLLQAANTLERFKALNFNYNIAASQLPTRSPSSGAIKYTISAPTLTNSNTAFEITATSTSAFARGGRTEVLKINSAGQRCISVLATGSPTCALGSGTTW